MLMYHGRIILVLRITYSLKYIHLNCNEVCFNLLGNSVFQEDIYIWPALFSHQGSMYFNSVPLQPNTYPAYFVHAYISVFQTGCSCVLFDFPQSRAWEKGLAVCSLLGRWSQEARVRIREKWNEEVGKANKGCALEGPTGQWAQFPWGSHWHSLRSVRSASEPFLLQVPGWSIYHGLLLPLAEGSLGPLTPIPEGSLVQFVVLINPEGRIPEVCYECLRTDAGGGGCLTLASMN